MSSSSKSSRKKPRVGIEEDRARVRFNPFENEAPIAEPEPLPAKVILAVTNAKKSTAAACYDSASNKILVYEDSRDDSYDLVEKIVEQVNPRVVLVSSKSDEAFIDKVRSTIEGIPDSEATVQVRPAKEWQAASGRAGLQDLRIISACEYHTQARPDYGDDYNRVSAYKLESFVNLSAPVMMSAVACLLAHLARSSIDGQEGDLEGFHEVDSIEMISLDKVLQMNMDALTSLQIFSSSVQTSVDQKSLSLFALLNSTCTPQGKVRLQQWMLRPSAEIEVINARHDVAEIALKGENQHLTENARASLKKIKNVQTAVKNVKLNRAKVGDWNVIHQFTLHVLLIKDAITSMSGWRKSALLNKLIALFEHSDCRTIGGVINDTIDWKETKTQNRLSIRPQVNDELDGLREEYASLPIRLDHIATAITQILPESFTETLNVVYFPSLGYLCTTPELAYEPAETFDEMHDWQHQFTTESYAYWKTDRMRDLDESFGDLANIIQDLELEILLQLRERVLEHEPFIVLMSEAIGELDCLLSFSIVSKELGFVRPKMTETNVCRIVEGRHPLVELVVDSFIGNDYSGAGGNGLCPSDEGTAVDSEVEEEEVSLAPDLSILVVMCVNPAMYSSSFIRTAYVGLYRGANGSGKSVYLKTVALIVYMAHVGCFVPCEKAMIGITDSIQTRVSTRESVSKAASAFMIDLQQISYLLRNSTSRSLLLCDEFGKGTETSDGSALFLALLEHLAKKGDSCPRVLLATHFQDVIATKGLCGVKQSLGLAHMALLGEQKTSLDAVTYTYRLQPGMLNSSYALHCARLQGIAEPLLTRAQAISKVMLDDGCWSDHLALKDLDLDDVKAAESVAKRFLVRDLDVPELDARQMLREVLLA